MVSLSITPFHLCVSQKPGSYLNAPSIFPVLNTKKRARITGKARVFCSLVGKRGDILGFLEVGKGRFRENSWCCWCKERWESEGDTELEAEILEFMENSSNPGAFPSKKELVEAGRLDLVEAIKNRGGWFSMGWDSEDETNDGENLKLDFDVEDFQRRVESCKESASLEENEDDSSPRSSDTTIDLSLETSSVASNQPPSSSGRSLENGIEEDSGIDGILNRLAKERASSLDIDVGTSAYIAHPSRKDPGSHRPSGTSKDVDAIYEDGNRSHYTRPEKLSNGDSNDNPYTKPDTWRSWSLYRAGFKDTEFEAAEISYGDNRRQNNKETPINEGVAAAGDGYNALHKWNLTHSYPIQTRLQQLQLELSSALDSLKSESEEINSKNVLGNSSSDLQSLSDALEFQENEFMSSQERLRSIRAKLAVLEGKMALAIRDAQKILEEKQMRIDTASRSLELLCTAYIVWPNSASEVFLVGSFDGWTTQRKMNKSRTGIFSLSLKLYPGRYEIKFIVDGKWRVDPLRPIAFNNGYENNLLIISEMKAQDSELPGQG